MNTLPQGRPVNRRRASRYPAWRPLALLVFLHGVLKNFSGRLVKTLSDGIYQRLAGLRLFRRTALRRYRRNIEANYRELKIPFRPDRPLPMAEVFVPLKVAGGADSDQINADGLTKVPAPSCPEQPCLVGTLSRARPVDLRSRPAAVEVSTGMNVQIAGSYGLEVANHRQTRVA